VESQALNAPVISEGFRCPGFTGLGIGIDPKIFAENIPMIGYA
jgi:hypothetical protein